MEEGEKGYKNVEDAQDLLDNSEDFFDASESISDCLARQRLRI